jgi:hypothetical protein
MRAPFRGLIMCHMIADSTAELLAMAGRIGVARKWIQKSGTYREHFDICLSKRKLAVVHGAIEISMREMAQRSLEKRKCDQILSPLP